MSSITKVTVNIPTEDFRNIESVAAHHDINRSEALLRLLRTGEAVEKMLRADAKITVIESNGTESVLRPA